MRHELLALLAKEPGHGYELRQGIEEEFGGIWPAINAGQIYTTLARLERDGLVVGEAVTQADRPNKRVFALTAAGHAAVRAWFDEPGPGPRVKDEFFTKLVLASRTGTADPLTLLDRQRRAHLRSLRELQLLGGEVAANPSAQLLVEGAALHLQADLKWLELCERHFTAREAGAETPPEERTQP